LETGRSLRSLSGRSGASAPSLSGRFGGFAASLSGPGSDANRRA